MKKLALFGILLAFALFGLSFDVPPDRADPNNWCFIDGTNCAYIWDGEIYIVGNMKNMEPIT